MERNLIFFLILIFIISSLSYATDWYVRPISGSYGAENGTSYENAWDGLLNVVWGPGGVQPGDTLYVCGTHYHTMVSAGSIDTQGDINMIAGSPGNVITIRGDYSGDPGITWGVFLQSHAAWNNEGDNTYSYTMPYDLGVRGLIFADIGSEGYDSYTLLDRTVSQAECALTSNSFYSLDYNKGSKLYVNYNNGSDPTGHIFVSCWGYEWRIPAAGYVKFLNIKLYANYKWNYHNTDNVEFNQCALYFGSDNLVNLRNGCDYWTFDSCTLRYCATGIYTISADNGAATHITIRNCKIYDCGVPAYLSGSGDKHGIGWQGGTGHIFEGNEIYNCGEGIVAYAYNNQHATDTIIRYNYIHNLDVSKGNAYGVVYGAPSNHTPGMYTGNQLYGNIIVGNGKNGRGIHYKWPDQLECYNNVFSHFDRGISCGQTTSTGKGPSIKIRNNIIFESRSYNLFFTTTAGPGNYTIDSDYNDIYSSGSPDFYFRDSGVVLDSLSFSDWQALSRAGCTFDPNGLAGDPKFTNESGASSNEADFQLQSNSPAIDTGTDVGLTEDYLGTSIPLGFAPDIGAFEYNSGSNLLTANINASPTSGVIPLVVAFTGRATGGTSPYSYSWNFGDGGSSTAQNPSYSYSSAGTYTVTLTVIDGDSSQSTDTTVITATDQADPLSATCTGSPTSGTAPLTVSFTGSANGGASPYSYSWNFGDGGSSTAKNPSHTYSNTGTYIAILTISDSESDQASDSLSVTISTAAGSQELMLSAVTGSPAPGSGGFTDPSPGSYSYPNGETVSVQAIPNTEYRFSSWKGDVDVADTYYAEVAIDMDADKSLSAYFCTKCGDANGDLMLTASDAQTAFDVFLGRIANPTQCEIENADVSCNGKVTPGDAQAIFNKFLKKGELPADCSGKTRTTNSVQRALQTESLPSNSIIVENSQVNEEGYVTVPIVIENPVFIDAFGFDLHFSPETLEFMALEPTELLKDFYQVDAYQLEDGELRVGGYSETPLLSESSEVLLIIVFRIKKATPDPIILEIRNTYDDLKNVVKKSGIIKYRPKGEKQNNKSNEDKKIRNFSRIPNLDSYMVNRERIKDY